MSGNVIEIKSNQAKLSASEQQEIINTYISGGGVLSGKAIFSFDDR